VASSHLNRKTAVSALVGVVAGLTALLLGGGQVAALIGWVVAGGVFLVWAWTTAWHADASTTREIARMEVRSRRTVDALIVGATVVSFVAVVFALVRSSQRTDAVGVAAAVLCLASSAVSWALVNTVYAFRLARLYYDDDEQDFEFDQSPHPTYSDFAFLAFTMGMSYTFEGAEIRSTATRRVALKYGLLSYAYGTLIIAVAVNLVTNLGQSG
jgi:uncharacterized membrane protein